MSVQVIEIYPQKPFFSDIPLLDFKPNLPNQMAKIFISSLLLPLARV